MALTDKELDEMEMHLKEVFQSAAEHCDDYMSQGYSSLLGSQVMRPIAIVLATTAQALLSLENERRMRQERAPIKKI